MVASTASPAGPLSGVRVIEVAAMGPVPFCGMVLGDLGADVIRVDRLEVRTPHEGATVGTDLRGRNKRSIALDLKAEAGREALFELLAGADILLEGFRPGVAERLGIGPDECMARQPRLVYGRATGWGQDGPLAMTAGHDINYIALSGALDMIGPPGGAPVPPLNLLGDYAGGALFLALGVVSAVLEARQSGRGQVIDGAMVDGINILLTVFHGFRAAGALHPERGSNALDGGAPHYGVYRTADGRYLAVGAIEARFYAALIDGMGLSLDALPDRTDRDAWPALREIFASRFAERSLVDWCTLFDGTDACVTPVLNLEQAIDHPHNAARQTTERVEGIVHPRPAPRFSRSVAAVRRPPAIPGEHSSELLHGLGWSPERVEALFQSGAALQAFTASTEANSSKSPK